MYIYTCSNKPREAYFKNELITIINALVFSKLYYCSSVWSNTTMSKVNKLQKVQNFAARIVSDTRKYDHISPVLKNLKWLPVKITYIIVMQHLPLNV